MKNNRGPFLPPFNSVRPVAPYSESREFTLEAAWLDEENTLHLHVSILCDPPEENTAPLHSPVDGGDLSESKAASAAS